MKCFEAKQLWQCLCLGLLCGLIFPAQLVEAADPAAIWEFNSAVNPAQPEVSSGLPETLAEVLVGSAGLGWTHAFPGLDSATGLYDLGGQGRITIRFGAGDGGISGPASVTIKVRQWFDGFVFTDLVATSVPGGVRSSQGLGAIAPASLGGWVATESVWVIPSGVTVNQATIDSPTCGAVVDEMSLALAAAPSEPLVLQIQTANQNGQVQISWPANAGNGVLESSLNPADPESWEASGLTASLDGNRYSVTTAVTGENRYFRVRK